MADNQIEKCLKDVEAFKQGIIESVNKSNSNSDANIKAKALLEALKIDESEETENEDSVVDTEVNILDKELEELKEVMEGSITEEEEADLNRIADEIVDALGDSADADEVDQEEDSADEETDEADELEEMEEMNHDQEEVVEETESVESNDEKEAEMDSDVMDEGDEKAEINGDEDEFGDEGEADIDELISGLEEKQSQYNDKLTDEVMNELVEMDDFDELVEMEDEESESDEDYDRFVEIAQKMEGCGKALTPESVSIASLFDGEKQLDEGMVEKYMEMYKTQKESMSRSHAIGRGQNKKDVSYPEELKRAEDRVATLESKLSERNALIKDLYESNSKMEGMVNDMMLYNDKLGGMLEISHKYNLSDVEVSKIAEAFENIDNRDKLKSLQEKLDNKYKENKSNFEKKIAKGNQISENKVKENTKKRLDEKKSFDDTSNFVDRFERLINFK